MQKPAIPSNEEERLQALINYNILDSESEIFIDDITRMASLVCGVPTALVSLIDRDRQWFKSAVGLNVKETSRDISFCGHAIHGSTLMEVQDATLDDRFSDNPLVLDSPNIRFYAGAPLLTPDGFAIGTLCVIDQIPRKLSAEQSESLLLLSKQLVQLFELRLRSQEIRQQYGEMEKYASLVADQKQQLFYTSKMAAMGQMASGIAHEINNPLAIILGNLELLKNSSKKGILNPEKIEQTLEKMIGTGKRITNIIHGLQRFARDGGNDLSEGLMLFPIIMETSEIMRYRCKLAHVSLKITCDKNLVGWGVPVSISQILVNLVSNSLDAVSNLQDRWIHIETFSRNGGVQVCVTDSGKGINPELIEKIMQPFFTTKSVGQGTGLGLSISKGLAESMGGKLELASDVKNTRFELWLPSQPAQVLAG